MASQSTTSPNPKKIVLGILLLPPVVQLLDLAAVDILAMLDRSYLRACDLPEHVVARGVETEYHYICESGEGWCGITTGGRMGATVRLSSSWFLPPL